MREYFFKYKKFLIIAATFIFIFASIFYMSAFFARGIKFNGKFLKKSISGDTVYYSGKDSWGKIQISVRKLEEGPEEGSYEIVYDLPCNARKSYTVNIKDRYEKWTKNVSIYHNSELIFKGKYGKYSGHYLYDTEGNPLLNDVIKIEVVPQGAKGNPYLNYEPSKWEMVNIVLGENEKIRGNVGLLLIALVIIAVMAIDIKWPLFFFTLKHFLSVRDPEPSDFYLKMQKVGWVAMPVIAMVILVVALIC